MDGEEQYPAQSEPVEERVGWAELWRWVAPWVGAAALLLVGLLGLFVASRAEDDGTYAGGFAAAAIAALALIWLIRTGVMGEGRSAGLPLFVESSDALILLLAVLVVLGLFGLFIAARGQEPMATYGGYGLFLGALIMIFLNVKHYFDRRER